MKLEPDEVMSVYGSQEGMAHIGLVLCNPGESILVPNPGYPLFEMSGIMTRAAVETYKIEERNGYCRIGENSGGCAEKNEIHGCFLPAQSGLCLCAG